ncbi:MAG: efflux RND transporter periplasmic adaptor subunit [Hyphomicrobiaceae bacterium]
MSQTSSTAEQTPAKRRTWIGHISNAIGVTVAAGLCVSAVAAGTATLHSRAENRVAPAANPPVTVSTQPVSWSDHFMVERGYVGRLEPSRQTALAFERPGVVVKIEFDEGDAVKRGAVVAKLDTAKLAANRRELVARRDELIARRDLAKLTMNRQGKLETQGWSSRQRYDEARFGVAELTAGIARVDAAIDALDVDLRKSTIRAPFPGRVAARSVDEGAVVSAGTQVLTILEAKEIRARIGIAPSAASELVIGQGYAITANGRSYPAKLKALRADLEAGSRTVTGLFSITSDPKLPFGEVVVLNLSRRVEERGIWLPLTALSEGRKGMWTVLLASEQSGKPIVERETVEVLHVAGKQAYVRGALMDGDRVITTGTNRVTPGQNVVLAKLD